jgi:hypothetical protein
MLFDPGWLADFNSGYSDSEPSDFERTTSDSADNPSAAVSTAHRFTDERYDERIARGDGEGDGGGGNDSESWYDSGSIEVHGAIRVVTPPCTSHTALARPESMLHSMKFFYLLYKTTCCRLFFNLCL